MKTIKSPCIDICEFTGPNKWCIGCGRTRNECFLWDKLKPFEKKTLISRLKKRKIQMKQKKSSGKNK